jgi:hypothetical protein
MLSLLFSPIIKRTTKTTFIQHCTHIIKRTTDNIHTILYTYYQLNYKDNIHTILYTYNKENYRQHSYNIVQYCMNVVCVVLLIIGVQYCMNVVCSSLDYRCTILYECCLCSSLYTYNQVNYRQHSYNIVPL